MTNKIEIQVIADVEGARASLSAIPSQLKQMQSAGVPAIRQVDAGMVALNRTTEISRRSISAATGSMRFMAVGMVSQLSPALGATVSQFASLGTVAAATGGTLATIAGTAGVGALVLGLGYLFTAVQAAETEMKGFREAASGTVKDLPKLEKTFEDIRSKITGLEAELEKGVSLWKRFWLSGSGAVEGFAGGEGAGAEAFIRDQIAELQKLATQTGKNIDVEKARAQAQRDAEAIQKEGARLTLSLRNAQEVYNDEIKRHVELLKAGAIDADNFNRAVGRSANALLKTEDAAKKASRAVEDFTFANATEELRGLERQHESTARVLLDIRDKFGDRGVAEAAKAAGLSVSEYQAAMDKLSEDPARKIRAATDALEAQREAWKKTRGEIVKTADAVADVFSDTLFDALKGEVRTLGELLKRTMLNAAKEASRGMFQDLARAGFRVR